MQGKERASENTQSQDSAKRSLRESLNGRVFWVPMLLMLAVLAWGFAMPELFANCANVALAWVLENFNWFIVPFTSGCLIFCLWAGFSKYGKIKLGGKDATPKLKTTTWFAVTLCSGIGIGITYYGTYQPLELFHNPPEFLTGILGGSEDAMLVALRLSFLEFGFHPYALYTCVGVVLAFVFYNVTKRYRIREGLVPLFGKERMEGTLGNFIDGFAIFVILAGMGGSTALAIMQIGQGTNYLFGVGNGTVAWLVIAIALAAVFFLGSSTGLHKVLSWLGNANTWLYIALMAFVFVVVDWSGILNIFWTGLGDYLQNIVGLSLYLEPLANTGWVGNNTTYFFAFWIVFAPMTGLFLIKLAYGRTIREFVLVNMIAPVVFVLFWFSVFGGGAILFDAENAGAIYAEIQELGPSMAWFALFDNLPFPKVLCFCALVAVFLSIVTLGEGMAMSLASMSCKDYSDETGETRPPTALCAFWAIIMGAVAYMLLFTGGQNSISTAVVVCGLPTAVLMLLMLVSHIKAMRNRREYDLYYADDPELKGPRKME